MPAREPRRPLGCPSRCAGNIERGPEDVTIAPEPQTDRLPSWDLSRLYDGVDDPRLTADVEAQLARAQRFAETYRGRINSPAVTADLMLAAIREYEEIYR